MADAFIPTHRPDRGNRRRAPGPPGWLSLKSLLRRQTPRVATPAPKPYQRPAIPSASVTALNDVGASHGRPQALCPVLKAYAASTLKLVRQADTLDLEACALSLGPVAPRPLVEEVLQDLGPLAREAGLTLLGDSTRRCDGVCCADPGELRRVLSHLVLRALSMQQAPGHVRLLVTFTGYEARILILSRAPATRLAVHGAARDDLLAPQRLLRAMGGSLVLEPRRAGYLPLCIALPALCALSDLHAA